MEPSNWRQDPDRAATMIWLGAEIQWYTCDCGAHWLGDHCGPGCVHHHRQYPDWDLCNWPPEMLKYWDIRNWRARTPPVDFPAQPEDYIWLMAKCYQERHGHLVLEWLDQANKVVHFNAPIRAKETTK